MTSYKLTDSDLKLLALQQLLRAVLWFNRNDPDRPWDNRSQ